jgi:hypothetical protein
MEDIKEERWPNIQFTESGKAQLDRVREFLTKLEEAKHEKADEITKEFIVRMGYLNDYGGQVAEADARRRFKITLSKDWADLSFSITWQTLNLPIGEYGYPSWNGGLIWHGGPNEPFCVSITPQWWGVHS